MIKLTAWPKSRRHPPRKIDIHVPGNTEFWVYISPRRWPRDPINPFWALVVEERRPGEFEPAYRQERISALREETVVALRDWLAKRSPGNRLRAISWKDLLVCLGR